MGEIFDVLINLITKSSGDGVQVAASALADLEAKVKSSNEFLEAQTALLVKQKAAAKELAAEYKDLAKKFKGFEDFSPEAKGRMSEQNPEYKKYLDMQKAVNGLNKEITNQTKVVNGAKVASKELGKELKTVKEVEDDVREAARKTNELLTKQASLLAKTASQLTRFGTGAMVGGTAILGGLFAEANRYAKEAKNATAATIQWNAALASLATSRKRVDETIAQTILPYLREASQIVDTASRFIQANPQIVTAALTVGASLVTIGALAKVLAVPIKLMSDRLYYMAQIAEIAALKENTTQLAIANGKALVGGGGGASAILTTLIPIVVIAIAAFLGAQVGSGIGNTIGMATDKNWKIQSTGDAIQTAIKAFQIPGLALAAYLQNLGVISSKTGQTIKDLAQWIRDLYNLKNPGMPPGFNPPVAANTYNPAGTSGGRRYVSPYTKAEPGTMEYVGVSPQQEQTILSLRQVDNSLAELKTNYTATLQSITADFLKNQQQAETEYANQRARVVREGSLEIQRIEQDSQRRLAKLALDHEDKMYSLTLQRDALGIVQEQRDYARAREEEEGNTNLEIKRRRADIALKLADMAKQYKVERAMAVQQYQAQLAIEKQKYIAQQSVLIAQRNDLLLFLNDERTWRQKYNAAILADLAIYAAAWRATLASALIPGSIPGGGGAGGSYHKAAGGYADYGQYLLGDNPFGGRGPREFVLSGRTTRAAEQMLGGQITQQGLIAALSGAGGGLHIVDNSRYATTISASDRRSIRQGAVADVMTIVGATKK